MANRQRDDKACKLVDFIRDYVSLTDEEEHSRRYCWDNKRGQLTKIIENKFQLARDKQLQQVLENYDIPEISTSTSSNQDISRREAVDLSTGSEPSRDDNQQQERESSSEAYQFFSELRTEREELKRESDESERVFREELGDIFREWKAIDSSTGGNQGELQQTNELVIEAEVEEYDPELYLDDDDDDDDDDEEYDDIDDDDWDAQAEWRFKNFQCYEGFEALDKVMQKAIALEQQPDTEDIF